MVLLAGQSHAQRVMDSLDRGLVAVATSGGVFVSWRVLGEDADNVKFNLYRDGTLVNTTPLTASNFTDAAGSTASRYTVKTIIDGVEKETSKPAQTLPNDFIEIKIAAVPSNADGSDISAQYEPNDATVADVDGDGEMEVLIKLRNLTDPANGYKYDATDFDIIQVYKLDGRLLWWIDCGRNMTDFQSNEINIAAYDWDLDGKAECILRGADGMVIHMADGTAYTVGDPTVNTRPTGGMGSGQVFTHTGAEYLLYLEGATGKPYQVTDFPLVRLEPGETDLNKAWGDGYGHRSSKYFFGAPYLDGRKPSIFLARGIYTRHKMVAYDVDPATHQLIERWRWINNTPGSPWYGQGYHNYSIADVDWDGRDEIIFGSMVIDDNGRGLSTTGLGHGDSHHVGDFNPYIYGQEIAACNEDRPANNYRDATTSKIYYRKTDNADDGRAIAGNFTNAIPGAQFITAHDSESLISCVTNGHVASQRYDGNIAQNFRIFWDGDLLDESFNGSAVRNSNGVIYKYGTGAIRTFDGTMTNNDTKATPCFQGDIVGDWREEIILRAADNHSIRIYTTTIPTEHRLYTLLHDPQYRNAMVWQMNGYNQTPHQSFYLGELEGITQAPPSPTMNGRTELMPGATLGSDCAGKEVVMAATGNAEATVAASPKLFVDNAPTWVQGHDNNDAISYETFTHTLKGTGFSGDMKLVKLGGGVLRLEAAEQKHTGATEVWAGTLNTDAHFTGSHVWLNRFGHLVTDGGKFDKGITLSYGSELHVGTAAGASAVSTGDLHLGFGSKVFIDLFDGGKADRLDISTLTIEKKEWENGPEYNTPVLVLTPRFSNASTLPSGDYVIATAREIKGNLSDIIVEGLGGLKAELKAANGNIVLSVADSRAATDIVWTGSDGNLWNLDGSANFVIRGTGEPTVFVTGDRVIFDDSAISTDVNIPANIFPSEIIFNNSEKNFNISGAGFSGELNMEKKGIGRVTLANISNFTGTVTINNGILQVATLGSSEGNANGALGVYTNPIIAKGGMLAVSETGKMSHPFKSNGGGIEVMNSAVLTLTGTSIQGNGLFIKAGAGQLNASDAWKVDTMRIDAGKVFDEGDSHSLGNVVVFNGSRVELQHLDSRYSYSSDKTKFVVPDSKSGKLTLDGRCNYTGSLTGAGRLEVVSTFVRNVLEGDWSGFEGTFAATQTAGSNFDFYSSKDLAKATLEIGAGTTFKNTESQNNRARNTDMHIGALAGGGVLGGVGTYHIGGKNTDTSYSGTFGDGINIVKEGTGTITLSKAQTKMGTLTFKSGTINLRNNDENDTQTMTGTSPLTVNGTLTGCGYVGNKTVTFAEGSVLRPYNTTKRNTYRTLHFTGDVTMEPGSEVQLELTDKDKYSSVDVTGSASLAPVKVSLAYTPELGDEFTLWTIGNPEGVPALELPALPEGLYWDTTELSAANGLVKITDSAGIDSVDDNSPAECRIVSLDGIVVKRFTSSRAEAIREVNSLGSGVYILTIVRDGSAITTKIAVR